jgi:membrane associated rhomboid family serine protease
MFLIYGTDAPLYHYPIVTTVMIVINVFIQILVNATGYDVTPWILAFGDGLHPIQWVTHNFLHAGWLHLIGNMIFLLPFGLIVEGKIGWFRMLVLYMAIGTFQGFTQQVIMLPSDPGGTAEELAELFDNPDDPDNEKRKKELTKQWREDLLQSGFGSLGASAVIFGLLAVCVIWAPVNEFDVYFRWTLLISAPDGGDRQWSVLTVCGIFVAKEFFMFLMLGMPISSEALHLNGFIVGGVIGLATLYFGLVDCEGFDLISLWSGTKFKAKRTLAQERRERQEAIEAAKPKGPPQAVVPKMPHQLPPAAAPYQPPAPSPQHPVPQPPTTQKPSSHTGTAKTIPLVPRQPTTPIDPIISDMSLPEFDDGAGAIDPTTEARNRVEAMIARGEFPAAVRQLAETRKRDCDFVVSAASTGRLAEGLIKAKHIKPAITVMSIGCNAYPAYEPRWRIRIASLELSANQDPIAAIKQLKLIDKEMLDSKLRDHYVKIAEHAKRMAGR